MLVTQNCITKKNKKKHYTTEYCIIITKIVFLIYYLQMPRLDIYN